MLKRFRNLLTYADLGGRRHPRRYALAAALLLGLTLLVFGWAQLIRLRAKGEVLGASRRASSVSQDAAGNFPADPTAACPTDPEKWTFQTVYPEDLYGRLEPDCVYAGLERTVAWVMLTRLGWSKPKAAARLEFFELPWQPAGQVVGLVAPGEPAAIPLQMEWPAHPAYRYWAVDTEGRPALRASLQGCYRTLGLVVDRSETLNPDYPVLCSLSLDYIARWSVHQLGTRVAAVDGGEGPGRRAVALFGYQGSGEWVYLGERQDVSLSLEDPAWLAPDRVRQSTASGLPSWDARWLAETFDLTMQPLPDGWQGQTDPGALQAIGEALTRYINEE